MSLPFPAWSYNVVTLHEGPEQNVFKDIDVVRTSLLIFTAQIVSAGGRFLN
jgi:hypothetical protein